MAGRLTQPFHVQLLSNPGRGKTHTHKNPTKLWLRKLRLHRRGILGPRVASAAHDFEKKDFKCLQWILPRGIKRTTCW